MDGWKAIGNAIIFSPIVDFIKEINRLDTKPTEALEDKPLFATV